MVEIQDREKQQLQPAKGRVEKAHGVMGLVSTGLGIAGVAGTGAIWLINTFYLGTISITGEGSIDSLVAKVYDQKGHESTFHTAQIQILPGSYHLDVTLPDGRSKHFDTEVEFGKTTTLTIPKTPEPDQQASSQTKKHRWWQFWRPTGKSAANNSHDQN